MQDDALHLSWCEAPDSGMIAQLKQFGFQHAMKIDPPPKLEGRCPTAEMGAVKLGKFAYPIGSYREGRLFHKKIGFILLRYGKLMDCANNFDSFSVEETKKVPT